MTLTLKIAKQPFHMIYRIIMMHHDTRLGYKRFYDSEDTFRTNINWNLKPSLWPWSLRKEIYIFPWHSSLWLSTIKLSLVATESSGKVKGEFWSSGRCSWVVCILCPLSQSVCYCWWHSVLLAPPVYGVPPPDKADISQNAPPHEFGSAQPSTETCTDDILS